jgi:hypothetical protein
MAIYKEVAIAEVGDLVVTKGDTKVGYEVEGIGLEFIAVKPLHNGNIRYLTHNEFYAMFEVVKQREEN